MFKKCVLLLLISYELQQYSQFKNDYKSEF